MNYESGRFFVSNNKLPNDSFQKIMILVLYKKIVVKFVKKNTKPFIEIKFIKQRGNNKKSAMLKAKNQEKKPLLEKEKAPSQSSVKTQKMKVGEYQLHILVEATSGLYSGDRQQALDVIISMHTFGTKKYSSTKSDVGFEETFWGQHFLFQTKFDDTTIAQGQKLLISVHNRQKKLFQALIGNYQLSISSIYNSPKHCINHRWLALSNVEMAFSEVVGYIKVSVSMLGEQDPPMELQVQPIVGISKQKNVMIPPTIQKKNYQLSVQIFQGEYIIPSNGKTCDPYVGVQFGHLFSKTDPSMKNTSPIFMQTVYVPLSLPAVNQNIALRLNDFNYIQKIQVLGSHYINVFELIRIYEMVKKKRRVEFKKSKGKVGSSVSSEATDTKTIQFVPESDICAVNKMLPYTQMQWVNFYGPSADASNQQHKNIYQFFPQIAPYYVGSILMRMSIAEKNRPQRKVVKFKGSLPKQKKIYFQVIAQISAAINLYKKSKPYMLAVTCGHFEMQTDYQQAVNGFCGWNVRKTMSIAVYENQLVPDVFIYLIDDSGQKVCYLRYPPFPNCEDFANDKETVILQPQWVMLKPDLSRIIIQNEQGGYLKVGLSIKKKQKKTPGTEKRLKTQFTGMQSQGTKGRIIIQLICAQEMLALDEQGTSDPFFEFIYMQKCVYSSTKEQTLNPIYFEKLFIQSDIPNDSSRLPPLIVNAYDKDQFTKEFIGTTFINLDDGLKEKWVVFGMNDHPQPKWFELRQNNALSGRFLASFVLLPKITQQIPKTITMPSQQFVITLLILGIRGLKQNSILPIKNPYVIFDVDSFDAFQLQKPSSEHVESQNIKTQPKEIHQILNLKLIEKRTVRLPSNPQYWPALSARIKNEVMPGFYQPLLGYFSINLSKAYTNTQSSKALYEKHSAILAQKNDLGFQQYQRLQQIDEQLLINLRNAILISLNYSWPVMSKDITLNDQNSVQKFDTDYVVIFPCYEQIQKGKQYQQLYKQIMLGNRNYMKIGFDNTQARCKKSLLQRDKHYRFVINNTLEDYELEKTGTQMGMFDESPIRIGRCYPSNDLASNLLKKFTQVDHYVGKYKGHCFIEKADDSQQSLTVTEQQRKKLKNFLKVQKFHLYLYILEAFNIPQNDLFSKTDPYLVVKIGDKILNYVDQYIQDSDNPQFNKKIYQVVELPEDAILEIQVWDYDTILGDNFVGSTIVDLENRAFYQENNITFNNPIQTHKLHVKQSKIPQGSIRFWLDLIPHQKHSLYREYQIGNQQDSEFEVRIVIWSCSQIPDNNIEGMADLYVSCTCNNETQTTDTHIRAATGFGSFNWRCVYKVKLPTADTFLSFRVFDKDLLTADDYICSTTFSIANILDQAFQTREPQKLYLGKKDLTKYSADGTSSYKMIDGEKLYDRFQIPLQARADKKNKQTYEDTGKLQLSVEVLPKSLADKKPVGLGRDGPNQYPYLEEPKDRFQWSWNPIVLISRLCGRSFRYKLGIALLLVGFILLFWNYFHSFGGATTANVISTVTTNG